jgi:heme oxygenase (biliverdin-IX-beta and delta-forming)
MAAVNPGSDVMLLLREETRVQHEQIENTLPFFRPDFTRQEYVRTLVAFLGFFLPVEASLARVPGWESTGVDLESRMRTSLLRSDLRFFGLTDAAIDELPRCVELPQVRGIDSALGVIYVLEGSRLGGALIARQVAERFGLEEGRGAAFFSSEGRNVGREWRALADALRGSLVSSEAQANAVLAAQQTFACLGRWMTRAEAGGNHEERSADERTAGPRL